MIDPANKNIQRYVDTGDYFRDAVDWYCAKYISPMTHRSYLMVLIIVSIISAMSVFTLFFTSIEVKTYPLAIDAEDQVKFFPTVKALSTVQEPTNISVSRYLATRYVKGREEYKYNDFIGERGEFTRKMIQSMSSRRVFREYSDYVNPEINADSPQVLYKSFIQRLIKVQNVQLLGSRVVPDKAIVKYEVNEKSDTTESKSNWVAEISFSMIDLEKKDEKGKPTLSFTVTAYKTYKLN